uniref:Ankyrin repeat domain 33Bb n=1 Tax=Xiphophorus couchianus TaxID=32473 RepID=A0A3B5LI26_9TELE
MSICKVDEDGVECAVSEDDANEEAEVDYTRNYWEDEDDIYQEFEELDFDSLPDRSDTHSITTEDSFYPLDDSVIAQINRSLYRLETPEPISFFKACCNNNPIIVKIMIRQGVTEEEVKETDRNRRSGLIAACYHGYVDVVMALSQCPYLDVNWQDNEGNTALIIAAQAGHVFISNYLLNYFPGLDIERRNCHGFTAALMLAGNQTPEITKICLYVGSDIQARDYGRRMTPREWALFTGRYETADLMLRLISKPCAEQFCDSFPLEWPLLEVNTFCQRLMKLISSCPYRLYFNNKVNPVNDGVLEHMVRITTGISSPFMATACHTVCPGSPPCVGKRRHAVQEILRRQRVAELKRLGPDRLNNYKKLFQNSRVLLIPKVRDRRASLQPQLLSDVAAASTGAIRRASLLPLNMLRRSSVRPGIVVPKVTLCKAPPLIFVPETSSRNGNDNQLQIPKWDYKMKKIERRQEEERRRMLSALRRR